MINIDYQLENQTNVQIPQKLIFGRTFTTHYFEMDYSPDNGWHNAKIKKYENIEISPASLVLHYGQSIFEGLKAYKHNDGKITMFRPDKNIERMNNSAKRMVMPSLDPEFILHAMKELIKVDKDWIPTAPGHSLYIRPVLFGFDPFLGVKPADTYKFFILLSPVGPYYATGFKPVSILATDKYVRAVRKGVGDCKTAGNYAASLLAQREAQQEGYSQVLWLDAIEQKYIEEVGTMNLFIQFENEIATAPLAGTILPGVTRMSVIQILKDWGYNVNERRVNIDEVVQAYKTGTLKEIFGTGTAAVISSVGKLKYKDDIMQFSQESAGELGTKLYDYLTGIHYGNSEDKYGWNFPVE